MKRSLPLLLVLCYNWVFSQNHIELNIQDSIHPTCIAANQDGNCFIGTAAHGFAKTQYLNFVSNPNLAFLDTGLQAQYPSKINNVDLSGNKLCVATDSGLYVLVQNNNSLSVLSHLHLQNSILPTDTILDVVSGFEFGTGIFTLDTLWLTLKNHGIAKYSYNSIVSLLNTSNSALPTDKINGISVDPNQAGHYFLSSDMGLIEVTGTQISVMDTSNSLLPSNKIASVTVLKNTYPYYLKWAIATKDNGFVLVDTNNVFHIYNSSTSSLLGDSIQYFASIYFSYTEYTYFLSSEKGLLQLKLNSDYSFNTIVVDSVNNYTKYTRNFIGCGDGGYMFSTISDHKLVQSFECTGGLGATYSNDSKVNVFFSDQRLNVEVQDSKPIDIRVCDMLGNTVWAKTNQTITGNSQYEINNLPSGVYIVNVSGTTAHLSKKFVVHTN